MKTLILLRVFCVPLLLTGLFLAVSIQNADGRWQSRFPGFRPSSGIQRAEQKATQKSTSLGQETVENDTVLVSRKAVESSIETLQKVNEQELAGVEELKKQIASPALTGKERLQMQVQIETAIENITQRGAVIWTLQSVLQDTTLQILNPKR